MKYPFINKLTKPPISKLALKATICTLIHLIKNILRVATSLRGRTIETTKGAQNATPHLTFLYTHEVFSFQFSVFRSDAQKMTTNLLFSIKNATFFHLLRINSCIDTRHIIENQKSKIKN